MAILMAVLLLKRRLLKTAKLMFCELVEAITQNLDMGIMYMYIVYWCS